MPPDGQGARDFVRIAGVPAKAGTQTAHRLIVELWRLPLWTPACAGEQHFYRRATAPPATCQRSAWAGATSNNPASVPVIHT